MNIVQETVEITKQNFGFAECCDLINKHSLCEKGAKKDAEEERSKKTGSQMLKVGYFPTLVQKATCKISVSHAFRGLQ